MASYLDRLIAMQAESYGEGTTMDPFSGGFLLPEGDFLILGMYGERGDDHRVVTGVINSPLREKFNTMYGGRWHALVHVCKKVGMYRWMPEAWTLEAWTPPTREQLNAIRQLHRHKPLTIEVWRGGRSWTREFEAWDDPAENLAGFFRYGARYFMRGDDEGYY